MGWTESIQIGAAIVAILSGLAAAFKRYKPRILSKKRAIEIYIEDLASTYEQKRKHSVNMLAKQVRKKPNQIDHLIDVLSESDDSALQKDGIFKILVKANNDTKKNSITENDYKDISGY